MKFFRDHKGRPSPGQVMAYILVGVTVVILAIPYLAMFRVLPAMASQVSFTDLTSHSRAAASTLLTTAWGFFTTSKAPESIESWKGGGAAAADPSQNGGGQ